MKTLETSPDRSARLRGIVLGALVADSLALGPHWIYKQAEITQRFGRITRLEPPATKYHPGKQAGDFTHLGDQAWLLLRHLAQHGGEFDATRFAQAWRDFWDDPATISYRDHATRTTLKHLAAGQAPVEAGAASTELAGPARGVVLAAVALARDRSPDEVAALLRAQTSFTHRGELVEGLAHFLADALARIVGGTELRAALALALEAASPPVRAAAKTARASALQDLPTAEAIAKLGLSCNAIVALPACLFLIERHGHDFAECLIENAMAGGDSAARGLVLGALLGATHGVDAIPGVWLDALRCRAEITAAFQNLSL